ncbi:hypothetical protein M3Y96_00682300 [Aphelenchoides besseyi]|nr:hypothetical protein M3Y96_00682300 [Aphelenchoides besseyi]
MPSIFTTDSIANLSTKTTGKYEVSSSRWYLLLSLSLLNFSYGLLCTSLLPLRAAAQATICNGDEHFGCNLLQFILHISYPVAFVVMSPLLTILIIKAGTLPSIYISIIFGLISVAIKFTAFFVESLVSYRYLLVLSGKSLITTFVYSFDYFSSRYPFNFPSDWFNLYRCCFSSLVWCWTKNTVDELVALGFVFDFGFSICYITFAFALLPVFPLLGGVWSSRPKKPPSISADDVIVNRRCAVPRLFNSASIIHCIIFAFATGAVLFTLELHNQIICTHHYLYTFIGVHSLLMLVGSLIGGFVIATFTDLTYAHKKIYRICYSVITISSSVLSWAISNNASHVFIIISLLSIGFFGPPLIAIGIEIAVETSFSQHPSKPTAMMLSGSSISQLIYISTAVFGQKYLNRNQPPNSSPNSECKARGSVDDYTATQIAVSMSLLVFFFLQLVFLKWRPKRKILEKNESFQINEVLQKNILGGELRTRC